MRGADQEDPGEKERAIHTEYAWRSGNDDVLRCGMSNCSFEERERDVGLYICTEYLMKMEA